MRVDIQVLRAIAVLLVIFDHLALIQRLPGSPHGGFIGVDVFFVISGFLITGHLADEMARNGRISFGEFYRRRARRILPMAVLVILVTLLISTFVFWPWRTASSAIDGLWAALFVSNVAFALRGVDYFASEQVSVFQHYWSLSVEEQFYLLWPVVLLLAGTLLSSRAGLRKRLLWAALSVAVASLTWACIATWHAPASAYFSTFARGYQFAIGAAIALAGPMLSSLSSALRSVLSWMGVAIIAASVWIIDPSAGFPGPMGLLPAVGAAIFITAGTATSQDFTPWPLRSRAMTYLGDISFSLYLWHWPVIVFLQSLVPRDIAVIPGSIVITLGLSALSYRYVERAVLRSAWLAPGQKPPFASTVRTASRSMVAIALGVSASVLLVAAGDAAIRVVTTARMEEGSPVRLHAAPQPRASLEFVEQIQSLMLNSRERADWSGLKPDISALRTYGTELTKECWTGQKDEPRSCVRGNPNAPNTIVVFGDSIAMNAAFSVDEFVRHHPEWKLVIYAKLGCSFADVAQPAPDGSDYPECAYFRSWAVDQIVKLKPDVIWTTSSIPTRLRVAKSQEVSEVWRGGMRETLQKLSSVPRIMVVAPPPPGQDLVFCSRPYNKPQDCGGYISQRWIDISSASRSAAEDLGRTYVDTALWYCDRDGYCPAVIGDYIVRRDERHLTFDYGTFLAPLVASWVIPERSHSQPPQKSSQRLQ